MSRLERLSSLIKTEIAEILRRRVNDSRIGFISITDVEISTDLRHAKVFYSQYGNDAEKEQTRKGLKAASKFIKGEVGKVLHTKTVPDLHFKYDNGLERGAHIVQKLNELKQDD